MLLQRVYDVFCVCRLKFVGVCGVFLCLEFGGVLVFLVFVACPVCSCVLFMFVCAVCVCVLCSVFLFCFFVCVFFRALFKHSLRRLCGGAASRQPREQL